MNITQAYQEAALIDNKIQEVLMKYPVENITTREQQLAYLNFIRTIRSTLDIIQGTVIHLPQFLSAEDRVKTLERVNAQQAKRIIELTETITISKNLK